MAAAAAALEIKIREANLDRFQVINGDTVYHKSAAAIRTFTHATSAEIGRVGPFTKTAGELFAGFISTAHQVAEAGGSDTSVAGDTSASPPPTAGVQMEDKLFENVTCTGASARTDWGTPVYLSTDNLKTDLTLTRPSAPAQCVGIVWNYRSSNTADVLIFGLRTQLAMARVGHTEIMPFGYFDWANITDADMITSMKAPFHGRFLSLHAYVEEALVGSGGTALLNLEIGTTDVTGGDVTASTAAGGTKGTVLDGTAITAEDVFHEGDNLSLEASSTGGTQTSGKIFVYAKVERLAGI